MPTPMSAFGFAPRGTLRRFAAIVAAPPCSAMLAAF